MSGAIGKFDVETMERFNSGCLREDEIIILKKKGILVPIECDELIKINEDRSAGINNEKVKHFRIWTTSGCNARCYYCFENGMPNITMSTATADAIIQYIENLLQQDDRLEIEWFGGEPLLNWRIIDYISERLINICNSKKCTYQSSMISNGSLITASIVAKMKSTWKLSAIQITLDGYGDTYDSAKNYINSKVHNFEKVITNIKELAEEGVSFLLE